jgi:hypothetical protein
MSELSKGAKKILTVLTSGGYRVKTEYLFSNLKGHSGKSLRYDFAIFSHTSKLVALVEYDSDLHFKFSPFYHKRYANFLEAQERDRKKNSYALAHSIPLYRIPYWEIDAINSPMDIFKIEN